MTFDEYSRVITKIHNQLQDIASRTANQALIGCADASNPAFRELMQRHEQLVRISSELTERMISKMNSNG